MIMELNLYKVVKKVGELKIKVTSDMTEVHQDLRELESHIEQISKTVKRLNNNGINVRMNIKLNSDTMLQKLFKFSH